VPFREGLGATTTLVVGFAVELAAAARAGFAAAGRTGFAGAGRAAFAAAVPFAAVFFVLAAVLVATTFGAVAPGAVLARVLAGVAVVPSAGRSPFACRSGIGVTSCGPG